MKRLLVVLGLALLVGFLLQFVTRPRTLPATSLPRHVSDQTIGERIFHVGGCASCHSSAGDDSNPPILGGGLAMETGFGVFHVPNISSDPSNGIGGWTVAEFVNAMKMGVSPGGGHYYPAFPYTSYGHMSLEDLMDLKSFLDTLPATDEENKDHTLKFPWNIRMGLGLWKLLNLDAGAVISDLPVNQQVARGRYLVEGPGHCGECHTPRNWSGGLDKKHWLGGAPSPDGDGMVPNITPHEHGLKDWSQNDIVYYLESGFTPEFDTVGGSMAKVQENISRLPAQDREAIAAYLRAIPPLD